jgi:hypothetical protein
MEYLGSKGVRKLEVYLRDVGYLQLVPGIQFVQKQNGVTIEQLNNMIMRFIEAWMFQYENDVKLQVMYIQKETYLLTHKLGMQTMHYK